MFVGTKTGEDLACHYAAADVFVFPSKTDTFGLVLLEAMASGVPVAAYPVPGPLDVVDHSGAGCLDWDLAAAVRGALLDIAGGLPDVTPRRSPGRTARGSSSATCTSSGSYSSVP